jgi:AraC-like DNA-binding protein
VVEYVMQGKGTVTSDGKIFYPGAGDVYILHKGSNHCYYSDDIDPWVKIWVNFTGPLADSLIRDYRLTGVNHIPGLDLKELFYENLSAAKTWKGSPEGMFQQAAIIFHKMAISMYNAIAKDEIDLQPEAREMRDWIDRHIFEGTDIKELANRIYRSPSQAIRIFRRHFGVTPYEYLISKRMEAAKMLIRNTNLPIREIASRLNFADEHYFSNFFKSRAGVSPTRFRMSLKCAVPLRNTGLGAGRAKRV